MLTFPSLCAAQANTPSTTAPLGTYPTAPVAPALSTTGAATPILTLAVAVFLLGAGGAGLLIWANRRRQA